MENRKAYRILASAIGAYNRCKANPAQYAEWEVKHEATIQGIVRNHFPSGSGVDSGTKIDLDASTDEKLVFHADYHHMNENGMYDGWTEHTVTVRASLQFGYRITISGHNRNDIKDYLHEIFASALDVEITREMEASYCNNVSA